MISSEIKNTVAENCPKYRIKKGVFIHNFSNINNSCNNCAEFLNEECEEGLLDDLWNKIRLN